MRIAVIVGWQGCRIILIRGGGLIAMTTYAPTETTTRMRREPPMPDQPVGTGHAEGRMS